MKKKHIHYHKNGSIWAKGFMDGNKMVGYWEWFRKPAPGKKNGTIMRSGNFKLGKQVGKWTTYDQKGKPFKVTNMN